MFYRSKQLIKEALLENDFLTNLSPSQMREVVDYMELKKIPGGTYVIREGDSGNCQLSLSVTVILPEALFRDRLASVRLHGWRV